jgi:hypothetical protein
MFLLYIIGKRCQALHKKEKRFFQKISAHRLLGLPKCQAGGAPAKLSGVILYTSGVYSSAELESYKHIIRKI